VADGSGSSDNEFDYKKLAVVVGIFCGVLSALAALNSLTGFNPLHGLFPSSPPTRSEAAPFTTTEAPVETTTVELGPATPWETETTETTTQTTETTELSQPAFYVQSSQWDGPCGYYACSMSAVFHNNGGEGSGSATFYVMLPDVNQFLASCFAVLPTTSEEGVTTAGCTASSGPLQQYFQSHPGTTVRMYVTVNN
jgi:hypothetical protein